MLNAQASQLTAAAHGRALQKVDFFWINRTQDAFEWFVKLLVDIEEEQHKFESFNRLIDFHIYLTKAKKKGANANALALSMALEAFSNDTGKDALTGLTTRTHPGRPDWDEIFERMFSTKIYKKTSVFFCGPKILQKQLAHLCEKYRIPFRAENF